MRLVGERILLRDFSGDDVEAYARFYAEPGFLDFYGPDERTPEQARRLVELFVAWAQEEPRRSYQLAITEREAGRLIGSCGLRTAGLPEACAEFGLELSPASWGRGLATEASRVLLSFGFQSLGLREVRGISVTENARVVRLVQKLGFAPRGVRREGGWMDEKGWTSTEWVLTREAWSAVG